MFQRFYKRIHQLVLDLKNSRPGTNLLGIEYVLQNAYLPPLVDIYQLT